MSDPWFVAAAYALVLGGLSLYAVSIVRRAQAARRTARAIEEQRERDGSAPGPEAVLPSEASS